MSELAHRKALEHERLDAAACTKTLQSGYDQSQTFSVEQDAEKFVSFGSCRSFVADSGVNILVDTM